MKKIILSSFIIYLITQQLLFCQNVTLRVDSLVISSVPWNLSPGLFGRSSGDIRGNNVIAVKDSLAINEFISYVQEGLNTTTEIDFYFDPRVVVDVYCGIDFFSVSIDNDQRCRYDNRKVVEGNRLLYRWITKYVPR